MIVMAINKVEYGGNTLIDLTSDTVTPDTLLEGVTAHNAAGELITGLLQLSSGGGLPTLPAGYAMDMGLYVPDSDKSSNVTIDLPRTYRWNDSGKTSACYLLVIGVDIRSGTQAAALGAHVKFGIGERNHQMTTTTSGCTTSTTVFMNAVLSSGVFNQVTITGTSSYPLKKGHTYLWMVIGEEV